MQKRNHNGRPTGTTPATIPKQNGKFKSRLYGVPQSVAYCQQEHWKSWVVACVTATFHQRHFSPNCVAPCADEIIRLCLFWTSAKPLVRMNYPVYNQNRCLIPGNSCAWSGYATAVNVESTLRKPVFALQSVKQSEYVPSSNSGLYNVRIDSTPDSTKHIRCCLKPRSLRLWIWLLQFGKSCVPITQHRNWN